MDTMYPKPLVANTVDHTRAYCDAYEARGIVSVKSASM
jgi:hypothetical protein